MSTPPPPQPHRASPGSPPRNQIALPDALTSVPRSSVNWVAGIVVAYVVVSGILTALSLVPLSSASGDSADSELSGGGWIGLLSLVGVYAWTGSIRLSYEGSDGGLHGQVTTPVTVLTVLGLVAVAAVAWQLTRRWHPQSRSYMWAQVGAAVAACLVLLLFFGVIGRPSADEVTMSALTFGGLVRATALLTVAIVVGTVLAAPRGRRLRLLLGDRLASQVAPLSPSIDAAASHVAAWGVAGVLAGVVASLMMVDDVPLFASLTYLLVAVPAAATWGHLGGVGISAKGDQDMLSFLPSDLSGSFAWTLVSEDSPAILWLLPLVALVIVALIATRLTLLRSPGAAISLKQMAVTASALLVAWLIVFWLLGRVGVRFSGDEGFGEFDADFTAGPTWWTLVFLALTGVVVEVAHGFVGVRLVQVLPRSLVDKLVPRPHPEWEQYLHGKPATQTPPLGTGAPSQGFGADDQPTTVVAGDDDTQERIPTVAGALDGGTRVPEPRDAWAQPGPTSRRTKILVGGFLGFLVAVVCGWIVQGQVEKRYFGPDAAALEYASAVVDGRSGEAIEIGRLNIANSHRQLFADEVYSAAQKRPNAAEVTDVVEADDGQSASVDVEFEQDGERTTQTLSVERDGRRFLIFPKWRLAPVSVGQLSATVYGDKAVINGVTVDLAASAVPDDPNLAPLGTDSGVVPGYVLNLPALPGTYSLSLPESKYTQTRAVDIRVSADPMVAEGGDPAASFGDGATVQSRPTQAFVDEVNKQVKSTIDACVRDYSEDTCPWNSSYVDEEDLDAPNFSISEYPTWEAGDETVLRDGEGLSLDLSSVEITESATCLTDDTFYCDEGESTETTNYLSTSGWSAMLVDGKVRVDWTDLF